MADFTIDCSRSGVIAETAVIVIEESECKSNRPRESVVFFRRTQVPPAEPLQEEWPLEPFGLGGRWGYVFRFWTGELCLYQLEEGEILTPDKAMAVLFSNDWGILRTVNPKILAEHEGMICRRSAIPRHRGHLVENMTFVAIWETKTYCKGRLYFRASHRTVAVDVSSSPMEYFVLEYFNSECGVYRTMLALPLAAWSEKVDQISGKIDTLFRSSRDWTDGLLVERTPSVKTTPPVTPPVTPPSQG